MTKDIERPSAEPGVHCPGTSLKDEEDPPNSE